MVTFLGLSDTVCALIISAAVGINFLNACAVARYARRRSYVTSVYGSALVFFIALCFGLFSWIIFCCDSDTQPGINVNGVRVINVPAPYHTQQPSYGYYQQFNNSTEYSMQGQHDHSYRQQLLTGSSYRQQYAPPPPQQPPLHASYYVQHPHPVAASQYFPSGPLIASAPPME